MANNKNITFNQLEASMTKVKAEIDKKANTNHGTHVPTTGTANNATYLRNDNQWHKIVPSDIGAAPTSHGDHVTYSKTSPSAPGTASAGSAANVSRGDHVHPLQTTISGNAGTATKLQTARTLTIGNTGKSFNGSTNVSWSLSEIGALPTAGGTMTGNMTFAEVTSTSYPANSSKITWNGSTDGADIYYRVTASDKGQLVLNLRDDADATIGIALNGSVKTTFDTNGYYSGKANQANTLATARTINGTSFNGSANITTANWGTARTLTIGNKGQSVNGSGNVSWSLSEIGALPAAGGTVSGNLNVTGAFSIGGKKITINSAAPSSPAVGDIWIKI